MANGSSRSPAWHASFPDGGERLTPRALSLADALLLEVVVVRRKVSMIVLLLLGIVAVRIVGDVREAVCDGAFIYEQHKTRAR